MGQKNSGVLTFLFLYLELSVPATSVLHFLLQNITQCRERFSYFLRVPSILGILRPSVFPPPEDFPPLTPGFPSPVTGTFNSQ